MKDLHSACPKAWQVLELGSTARFRNACLKVILLMSASMKILAMASVRGMNYFKYTTKLQNVIENSLNAASIRKNMVHSCHFLASANRTCNTDETISERHVTLHGRSELKY